MFRCRKTHAECYFGDLNYNDTLKKRSFCEIISIVNRLKDAGMHDEVNAYVNKIKKITKNWNAFPLHMQFKQKDELHVLYYVTKTLTYTSTAKVLNHLMNKLNFNFEFTEEKFKDLFYCPIHTRHYDADDENRLLFEKDFNFHEMFSTIGKAEVFAKIRKSLPKRWRTFKRSEKFSKLQEIGEYNANRFEKMYCDENSFTHRDDSLNRFIELKRSNSHSIKKSKRRKRS